MLSGNSGKTRMKSDATLRRNYTWTTFVTLSGEEGIKTYTERSGKDFVTGLTVRFPDINVSSLKPIESSKAKSIKDAALKYYGHAGPVFARFLMEQTKYLDDPEELRQHIEEKAALLADDSTLPSARRAARVFALLWQIGELMQVAELLPAKESIENPVRWAWETYLSSSEADALSPEVRSEAAIASWLNSNWDLAVVELGTIQKYRSTEAWYDDDIVYLPESTLGKIPDLVCNKNALKRHLFAKDALIKCGSKNYVHPHIPGIGKGKHLRLKKAYFKETKPDDV